jgi:hypothetical protein
MPSPENREPIIFQWEKPVEYPVVGYVLHFRDEAGNDRDIDVPDVVEYTVFVPFGDTRTYTLHPYYLTDTVRQMTPVSDQIVVTGDPLFTDTYRSFVFNFPSTSKEIYAAPHPS